MGSREKGKHPKLVDASEYLTLEKPLPNNAEAERYILGGIILDMASGSLTVAYQAIEKLRVEDFFTISNQLIYAILARYAKEGKHCDPVTLTEELRRDGDLDKVGGQAYIYSLFDGVPRFSIITNYVDIVLNDALNRLFIKLCNASMFRAFDDPTPTTMRETVRELLDGIYRLLDRGNDKGFVKLGEIAKAQEEVIQQRNATGEIVTGQAMGFADLDYMLRGLQRGTVNIVAARPGMGKTALGMGVAVNACRMAKDKGEVAVVGVFELEMTTAMLVNRLISSEARVDGHRLDMGYLAKEEWRRIMLTIEEFQSYDMFIDDTPGIDIDELAAKATMLKHREGALSLLVIDYVGLIKNSAKEKAPEHERLSDTSACLMALAKALDVPILLLVQMNRQVEQRQGKPRLADLAGSGSLERDASTVMFIDREEVRNPDTENQNMAKVIIGKNRHGPVGDVDLVFLKQLTRFEDKWRDHTGEA